MHTCGWVSIQFLLVYWSFTRLSGGKPNSCVSNWGKSLYLISSMKEIYNYINCMLNCLEIVINCTVMYILVCCHFGFLLLYLGNISTFQGLQRQHGAINLLEAVNSYFSSHGLFCTLNTSSFTVDVRTVTLSLRFWFNFLVVAIKHDFIIIGCSIKRWLWFNLEEWITHHQQIHQLPTYTKDI